MKLLIIDIETTGFVPEGNSVVEIGIVLCDTDTREITTLFDNVVHDEEWDYNKHKNSWIFQNTDLTPEDVINSKHIEEYRDELQSIFDQYPITAYNKKFDLSFMNARGFKLKDTKDLMLNAQQVHIQLAGNPRYPKFEKVYNWFFPNAKYIEKHRGLDDAIREAEVLYKFCDMKAGKEVEMIYS